MCGQLEPLDEIETPENFSKKGEQHSYLVSTNLILFHSLFLLFLVYTSFFYKIVEFS